MAIRLLRASVVTTGGAAIRSAIAVIVHPALLHLLGLAAYGEWAVLNATFFMLVLADVGVSHAITVLTPIESRSQGLRAGVPTAIMLLLIQSSVLGAGVCAFAPMLGAWLFPSHGASADHVVITLVLALPFRLIQQLLAGFEAGIGRYDLQAIGDTVATVISLGGSLVLAFQGATLPTFAIWYLLAAVLGAAIHLALLLATGNHSAVWGASPNLREAGRIGRLAITYWPSSVAGAIFGQADRLAVNGILGAEAVGLYALSTSMATKINELSAMPVKPFMYEFSRAINSRDHNRLRQLFNAAVNLNLVAVLALAGALIAGSPLLASLLGNVGNATDLQAMLAVLAIAYGTYSLAAPGFFLLLADRRARTVSIWSWVGSVGALVAVVAAAKLGGVFAAAAANVAYAAVLRLNFLACRRLEISSVGVALRTVSVSVVLIMVAIATSILGNYLSPAAIAMGAGALGSGLMAVFVRARIRLARRAGR